MALKSFPNPDGLRNPSEISEVIMSLEEFESVNNTPAVVVRIQNLSLGESYQVLPENEVRPKLGMWRVVEA